MAKRPKAVTRFQWHSLFRGLYARVAKRLKVHPSFVSRVARGERGSAKVEKALQAEIVRLQKRRSK